MAREYLGSDHMRWMIVNANSSTARLGYEHSPGAKKGDYSKLSSAIDKLICVCNSYVNV